LSSKSKFLLIYSLLLFNFFGIKSFSDIDEFNKETISSKTNPSQDLPQTVNNQFKSFVPLIAKSTVIEELVIQRWQHTPGTYQTITYQWGDNLYWDPTIRGE